MSESVLDLEPKPLWKYFAELSAIPRGSKNEAAAAEYVRATAERLGLSSEVDAAGNVLVRKAASPGREGVGAICLQSHLDMVCEKNVDKVHDFARDPLMLVVDGDFIRADGTTLGADNGVGVAASMAIMADASLEHGPLEFLFTVDEETGLTGAKRLKPKALKSRTLINLDTEEWGALYVGCAGGQDTTAVFPAMRERAPAGHVPATLVVGGLRGGHSGIDIDKGRGNAIKIAARALLSLWHLGVRLLSVNGGSRRNVIPRDATVELTLPKDSVQASVEIVQALCATVRDELSVTDPDVSIALSCDSKAKAGPVIGALLGRRILRALVAAPHGVLRMSASLPGLVETSTNLAVVETKDGEVRICTNQRSSVASELVDARKQVGSVFLLAGAKVRYGSHYPGWKPDLSSCVLSLAKATYRQITGEEPAIKAVHAGLECGLIGEKYPGMDMISLGPTLEAVHSPGERMHIGSVAKFYQLLVGILKAAV